MVERLAVNEMVPGSSPGSGAMIYKIDFFSAILISMCNVLATTDDRDRESGALGQSTEAEMQRAGEISQGVNTFEAESPLCRAVDGAVYDQFYLKPTAENLKLLLRIVDENSLQIEGTSPALENVRAVLASNDEERITALVESIQQLRLFDARDKDISRDKVAFHPITIDIKFKAPEEDKRNREAIKWRANENGNKQMCKAIDSIKSQYEAARREKLGHVRRYIIAYEWLPASIVEAIKRELDIKEIEAGVVQQIVEAIGQEFAVKLDVRYDIVTNPDGKEVYVVTREAEVNGGKDQKGAIDSHSALVQAALENDGHATFIPEAFNFGDLALSSNPDEMIDAVIAAKGGDVQSVRAAMQEDVQRIMALFLAQIVVDISEKGAVLNRLTTVGDLQKVVDRVRALVA